MIADFEKKQMDSGIKLSTDEHIKEELKFLNDIVCKATESIISSIKLREGMEKLTSVDGYNCEMGNIRKEIVNIISHNLADRENYDNTISYEGNVDNVSKKITREVCSYLEKSSQYVIGRSKLLSSEEIRLIVVSVVKKWCLNNDEAKELVDKIFLNKV